MTHHPSAFLRFSIGVPKRADQGHVLEIPRKMSGEHLQHLVMKIRKIW